MLFTVGFISVNANASVTIATFADPSEDSNWPLFTVDFINNTINGGWDDNKTGLILEIPYSGYTVENNNAFIDAWFDITEVTITSQFPTPTGIYGSTGPGVINFYEDNTQTNPLVIINFDIGSISPYDFGANEVLFTASNVTITGSKIIDALSQEQFSFSFANLAKLSGSTDWDDGFTATAAFTSSAIPEPTTICLLAMGSLVFIKNKKTVNEKS